jgi:hypothetical protein
MEKKPKEPVKNPKEHITTNLANNFLYRILLYIYIYKKKKIETDRDVDLG